MAASYLSLVNQKLAHARVLLRALQPLAEPTNGAQRLEAQALIDAVSFHLVCAYQHYLRELGENYRVKQPNDISNETQLEAALAGVGKAASELRELQVLRQQPGSWLNCLHDHYLSCWSMPIGTETSEPVVRAGLIDVHDLDAAPAALVPVDYSLLQRWYGDFAELIARQRETSTEY